MHPVLAKIGNCSSNQYENVDICPVIMASPMATMITLAAGCRSQPAWRDDFSLCVRLLVNIAASRNGLFFRWGDGNEAIREATLPRRILCSLSRAVGRRDQACPS